MSLSVLLEPYCGRLSSDHLKFFVRKVIVGGDVVPVGCQGHGSSGHTQLIGVVLTCQEFVR